ncbi:MAG: hypothetical protein COX17_03900 [Deltaproteobacteria bacterium CG23_combo_of_CG06-09_8_20_14_all_60_8]|nr:MAG: hypothetical protein AUK28_05075 [Desulfobacterales bacterium CG2_30_60_27]PIP44006.1 MAG: hypothetical protein COX17_03900 [Deltaproteobacteria bacterium CG23_combo_of_CG06-09_8_20_14_all_60_8]
METYGWNEAMGMSLLEKLKADLQTAMRGHDQEAKDCIRVVMGEFPKLTVPIVLESGKKSSRPKSAAEITNDDILEVMKGLVKSERILLEAKKAASSRYLELLLAYLPQIVSREEVETWVRANIDLAQFKNAMQAMGPIMKHFGKAADGAVVREILLELAGA